MQWVLGIKLRPAVATAGPGVEIVLSDGKSRHKAEVPVPDLEVSRHDHEEIRWYLEEYREFPSDPAPVIGTRCSARLVELGELLFRALFEFSEETGTLWRQAKARVRDLRVEVDAGLDAVVSVPFELLREPREPALSLTARSFVHVWSPGNDAAEGQTPIRQGPIRILLAICRPRHDRDVPFRSVAGRLIRSAERRPDVRIKVLRPPTYEQLKCTLQAAKNRGEPFHIVHFDGHGLFSNAGGATPQGFAVFEDPGSTDNCRLVTGGQLGGLLTATGVFALTLNACGSDRIDRNGAHAADPVPGPESAPQQLHSFGSLARNALRSGLGAVVAMRYDVYVSAAATFVSALYERLVEGAELAEAVTSARRDLAASTGPGPRTDEWLVPVVYERSPVRLFDATHHAAGDGQSALPDPVAHPLDTPLPVPPDIGCVGRDDVIITVDRVFDGVRPVLLQGPVGSGKTTTAADFARWYRRTAGVWGPVVFTSLRTTACAGLDDTRRRLDGLTPTPPGGASPASALWVWDDVESAATWSGAERARLAGLLAELSGGPVRVLLIATDGAPWLPGRIERVVLGSLSIAERTEFAELALGSHAPGLPESVVRFSQGNPLVLQALCRQLPDAERIGGVEAWLEALHAGTGRPLEPGEGAPTLAGTVASLRTVFDEQEQRLLSLLLFFRSGVAAMHLAALTRRLEHTEAGRYVTALDEDSAARLLTAVAALGWLTPQGADFHAIHPMLPFAVRPLLDGWADNLSATIRRALTEHYDRYGDALFWTYNHGSREVLDLIALDEDNLLHARRFALDHALVDEAMGPMQALRMLYLERGRRQRWRDLVEGLSPTLLDPATGAPRSDLRFRDSALHAVLAQYLTEADQARPGRAAAQPDGGARPYTSEGTETASAPPETATQHNPRHEVQRLLGEKTELSLRRAVDLAHRIDDRTLEATALIQLGRWYRARREPRFERMAEACFEKSRTLAGKTDHLTTARALDGLGALQLDRVNRLNKEHLQRLVQTGAIDTSRPGRITVPLPEEAFDALALAESYYTEALELFQGDDRKSDELRASLHHQLGGIYKMVGANEKAARHYRQAVLAHDLAGDTLRAAQSRMDFANFLVHRGGRVEDALLYAQKALHDFQSLGKPCREQAEAAQSLVDELTRTVGNAP
ncbi:CHAT domain-containing protein [Streptomyces albiflavescens]|uniref:CHAT domain-containing protein n=1 Tax=Streptomyces albiflavescens TaxID=1623582 RepID=UPI001668D742|nr:CHAT domain-containing protein [Streptomyces albiflavescens]